MFIDDVKRNIINTDKLMQADDIIDKKIRILVKNTLRTIHGSEKLNRTKVVLDIFNKVGMTHHYNRKGMDEERDKIVEDLYKTSKDPYTMLKERLNDVYYIVDHIERDELIDFYKPCMGMGPEFTVQEWMRKVKQPTGTFDIIGIIEKEEKKENERGKVYTYYAKKEKEDPEKKEKDQ